VRDSGRLAPSRKRHLAGTSGILALANLHVTDAEKAVYWASNINDNQPCCLHCPCMQRLSCLWAWRCHPAWQPSSGAIIDCTAFI
jgi:hypothetical protein